MRRLVFAALTAGAVVLAGCADRSNTTRTLEPEHLYNGIGRPLWVRVPDVPDPSIALLEPATDHAVGRAGVTAGRADLAAVFPALWSDPPRPLVAQLLSGERPVGPALVLQPMTSPKTAALVEPQTGRAYWIDDSTAKPAFDPKTGTVRYYSESPVVTAGVRVYVEERAVLETTEGEMEFALRPDAAPNTAYNFRHLIEGGFYRDIAFHRVVPRDRNGNPFVIQVGDPTGTGDGSPGYAIDLEPTTLPHDFGVISMARDSEPNTNGSQVFVCLSREGTARLDGKYCAFGELTRGAEVVRAIAATPLKPGTDSPLNPPRLLGARLVDAPPRAPRP